MIATIQTPGGEELVILSRSEYDALLAAKHDPEEAWALGAHDEAQARLLSGEDVAIPEQVWDALESGGNRLRILRDWRGLGQMELAVAAGVAQPYVSEVEAGKKTGSARTLAKLARALAVPLDVLVGD